MLAAALAVITTLNPPGFVARIGTPAFRHGSHLLGTSADGRRLYFCEPVFSPIIIGRTEYTVLDADTGRVVTTYAVPGADEAVLAHEFSNGELRLLVRDPHTGRPRVRGIDPDTGLTTRKGKPWAESMDGPHRLASAGPLSGSPQPVVWHADMLRRLDPETGALTPFDPPLPSDSYVFTAPHGRFLVANLPEGGVRVYDLPGCTLRTEFKPRGDRPPGHAESLPHATCFTPDGRWLAVWRRLGDADEVLELHDLDTQKVRMIGGAQDGSEPPLLFDPTGKTFAYRGTESMVVRDFATGLRVATFPAAWQTMTYSADGTTLWGTGGPAVPIDAATGRGRAAAAPDPPGRMWLWQFRADGKLVGLVAGAGVFTWDPRTGREVARAAPPKGIQWHNGMSFDETGERLSCDTFNGRVNWDYRRGSTAPPPATPELEPPDGQGYMLNPWLQLVRNDTRSDLTVRVLPGNTADGRRAAAEWCFPHKWGFIQPHLAPGEKRLVVGNFHDPGAYLGPTVRFAMLDITDAKSRPAFGEVSRAAGGGPDPQFSPDGRWMAFVAAEHPRYQAFPGRGYVTVVDLHTRRQVTKFVPPVDHPSRGSFSPDGRTFAVGGSDGAAMIETATWTVRAKVLPPPGMGAGSSISDVRWSPRDRLFATSTPDARLVVWDYTRIAPPFAGSLADAWNALAWRDAARAFAAMKHLAADPAKALPLLRGRPAPGGFHAARSVEVVEWMGTPDAVKWLETWAADATNRVLAAEARAALARLR